MADLNILFGKMSSFCHTCFFDLETCDKIQREGVGKASDKGRWHFRILKDYANVRSTSGAAIGVAEEAMTTQNLGPLKPQRTMAILVCGAEVQ